MRGQQQNSTDQTTNFFWLLCLIIGGVLIFWWLARQWIVTPVFFVRSAELILMQGMLTVWAKIAAVFHLPVPSEIMKIVSRLQAYIAHASAKKISYDNFAQINWYIGKWTRYPCMAVLVALAGVIHFRHRSLRFREAHNMQSLKKVEVENWPQIKPVVSTDLIKEDIETGPWAMSKLPLDFCRENNLLIIKQTNEKQSWGLQRGPAFRIFSLQLGPLWRGVKHLPIYMKALYVIFAACAEKERDVAKQLILQIAASAESGQLNFTGVEELAAKYDKSTLVAFLEKRHAYVYTFMATLLELARTDGVIATAEFLWLKPLDRRLWYILNNIGRQAAFVESAGPYAHWLAEKKVGRGLKTPMVKEAVNALENTIEETLYIAEGDRWHTTNAA